MSDTKLMNIAKLITTYNFQIEKLPDNLKCAQCKLVLKDACQVPCGCTYCRVCVDEVMSRGGEFCPGGSEDCGESLLSLFSTDYVVNRRVSQLTVKCPHNGCAQEYPLANMEQHMQQCSRKNEECPFRELGCTQDKLAADEIGTHLQHENRRHSEILIEMIANINKEIAILKQRDEVSSREIETLKLRDEANGTEIEMLKSELLLKDGKIQSIINQMTQLQNANKSIKNDIKLIKEEKEDLAGRVSFLSQEIDRERAERQVNDELYMAKLIDHVDREIVAVTGLIKSNREGLVINVDGVRVDIINHIISINEEVKSITDDVCSLKTAVQSIQLLVGLEPVNTRYDWLMTTDVSRTSLYGGDKESDYFHGVMQPYKYRLRLENLTGLDDPTLYIQLFLHAGANDARLTWPFKARVIITVSDKDRRDVCRSICQHCQIERPTNNLVNNSDIFIFNHSELKCAGLNLSRGVRVSCVIDLSTGW